MKKPLLLMCLLFSFNLYAQDGIECAREAIRDTMKLKILGYVSYLREQNPGHQESLCDQMSTETIQTLNTMKQEKLKFVQHLEKELKSKGKVSSSYFALDPFEEGKKEFTSADICQNLQKEKDKRMASYVCGDVEKYLPSGDPLVKTPVEMCQEMLGSFKTADQERYKCHKEPEVVKRDPPGEEIAPAEEPTLPKYKSKKASVGESAPASISVGAQTTAQ